MDKEAFDMFRDFFIEIQGEVGSTIEIQQQAFRQALELLNTYTSIFDKDSIISLICMADSEPSDSGFFDNMILFNTGHAGEFHSVEDVSVLINILGPTSPPSMSVLGQL